MIEFRDGSFHGGGDGGDYVDGDSSHFRRMYMDPMAQLQREIEKSMRCYLRSGMFSDGVKAETDLFTLSQYIKNFYKECESFRDRHVEALKVRRQDAEIRRLSKLRMRNRARREMKKMRSSRKVAALDESPLIDSNDGRGGNNGDCASISENGVDGRISVNEETEAYLDVPTLDFSYLLDEGGDDGKPEVHQQIVVVAAADSIGASEQPEEHQYPRKEYDLATTVSKAITICDDSNSDLFSLNTENVIDGMMNSDENLMNDSFINNLAMLIEDDMEVTNLPIDNSANIENCESVPNNNMDVDWIDADMKSSSFVNAIVPPPLPVPIAAVSSPSSSPPCWWGRAFDDGTESGMMKILQDSECVYVPFCKLINMFDRFCNIVNLSPSSKLPVIETCYYINGCLTYGKKHRRKPPKGLREFMHETFGFDHDPFAFNVIFGGENDVAFLEYDRSYCNHSLLNKIESVFKKYFTLKPWTFAHPSAIIDHDTDSSRVILHENIIYVSLRSFVNITIGIRRISKISVNAFQFFLVVKKGNSWLNHNSANVVIWTGDDLVWDHALKGKMNAMKDGESDDFARLIKKNGKNILSVPKHGCNVAFSDVDWCRNRDGDEEIALENLKLLSTCARPSCFDFDRLFF